jgi:hypothetical protein
MATLPLTAVAHDGGFIELGYTVDKDFVNRF